MRVNRNRCRVMIEKQSKNDKNNKKTDERNKNRCRVMVGTQHENEKNNTKTDEDKQY